MPICEFGERQYELAANLELVAGNGSFFAPTQQLEKHVAIDIATTPGDARIWGLLGIPAPLGVRMGQTGIAAWQGHAPPFLLSLFVQYKRSYLLTRGSAREWGAHQTDYWRVELSRPQHERLLRLERGLGADAVVRYAAPTFWRYEDMWRIQGTGQVLDNSLLFSPGQIDMRHERVTWSPGRGLVGHSEPEPLETQSARELASEIIARRIEDVSREERENPQIYLERLAGQVEAISTTRRPRERWRRHIEEIAEAGLELPTAPETISTLADLAVVAEQAHSARASWLLLVIAEQPPDALKE